MELRTKLILFAVAPLLLTAFAIALVVSHQAAELSVEQVAVFEREILKSKRNEIRNYIELAQTSIDYVYRNAEPGDQVAQDTVKRILHGLTFGADGYFFVYDEKGVNLVHPKLPQIVGKNLWEMADANGNKVIQHLISKAKAGGNFHRYLWHQPSSGDIAEKISYSVFLDKWGWMIGTGLYIDDVTEQVTEIEKEVASNVRQTFILIFAITLTGVVAIAGAGLFFNISEQKAANTKLKRLTQKIVEIQEDERQRVAKELHDGISQLLISVKYGLDGTLVRMGQGAAMTAEPIELAMKTLEHAIQEVRRISKDLRPSVLDDLGLAAALESLGTSFFDQTGISTVIEAEKTGERLASDAKTALYRVAQEALTNIARHAGANEVQIRLKPANRSLAMIIADDGCGFDPKRIIEDNTDASGLGIGNMRERIEGLGGRFRLRSRAARGTTISITMPLMPEMRS